MFQWIQFFFSLYSLLMYAIFRGGIYSHLRLRKISKTAIKKSRKGFQNYWLYWDIHKNYGLGCIYGLNLAYFCGWIVHLSMLLLSLGFSWLKLPLLIFSCTMCMMEIPAAVFASVNENRAEFGNAFVLLARTKETGELRSSLIDLFSWVCSVFLVYLSFRGLSL